MREPRTNKNAQTFEEDLGVRKPRVQKSSAEQLSNYTRLPAPVHPLAILEPVSKVMGMKRACTDKSAIRLHGAVPISPPAQMGPVWKDVIEYLRACLPGKEGKLCLKLKE